MLNLNKLYGILHPHKPYKYVVPRICLIYLIVKIQCYFYIKHNYNLRFYLIWIFLQWDCRSSPTSNNNKGCRTIITSFLAAAFYLKLKSSHLYSEGQLTPMQCDAARRIADFFIMYFKWQLAKASESMWCVAVQWKRIVPRE